LLANPLKKSFYRLKGRGRSLETYYIHLLKESFTKKDGVLLLGKERELFLKLTKVTEIFI